jgi:hypothetical protein
MRHPRDGRSARGVHPGADFAVGAVGGLEAKTPCAPTLPAPGRAKSRNSSNPKGKVTSTASPDEQAVLDLLTRLVGDEQLLVDPKAVAQGRLLKSC